MNKLWLGVGGVLLLVVAVWLSRAEKTPDSSPATAPASSAESSATTADDGNAADGATVTPEPAEPSPFDVADDRGEQAPDADTVGPEPVDNDTNPDESSSTDTAEGNTESNANSGTSQAEAQGGEDNADENRTNADSDTASGERARPVGEVPESYPVTDAELYFVPKEERRPGNLGGPPPLNFPGGPSDPNRPPDLPAGNELTPPPAPGQ